MSAKVLLICQTFTDIIRKVECYVFTRNIINLLRKGRQGTKSIAEALCNLWSATRWQEILISMNNGLERTLSECHCHKVYYKNVLLPLLTETHFGPVRLTHTCQLMGQKRWSEEITSLQIKHTHSSLRANTHSPSSVMKSDKCHNYDTFAHAKFADNSTNPL